MIETKGLSVTYASGKTIRFADWSLEQGKQAMVLGTSGSGKTTLLHAVAGLLSPATGKVWVNGTDMYALSGAARDRFRGRHIGIVFQKPHLVQALNVHDNLAAAQYFAGLPHDSQRIKQVTTSLGIVEKLQQKPHTLSQGEAQRVAIARALVNKPAILLADEPTSSLDDVNAASVLALLTGLSASEGATLIVVTHDQRVKDQLKEQLPVF